MTVQRAVEVLKARSQEAGNLRSSARHFLLSSYLDWVRESERQFRPLFADREVLDRLYSPRYWHLRAHGRAEDVQVGPAGFHEEFDAVAQVLQEAVDILSSFNSLIGRPGEILVLDTNMIMHNRPFTDVDWRKEAESKVVRLMIPLLVLDELDAKTYASSKQLAGRAETRLRLLDHHIERAVGDGSPVKEGVTVEILPDPPGHRRSPDADHEILNRAEFLQQLCGDVVRVISGDRGMRVRGIGRAIPVQALSDKWRLPLTDQTAPQPAVASTAGSGKQ